jgi:hypothetical protein
MPLWLSAYTRCDTFDALEDSDLALCLVQAPARAPDLK